MLFVLINALFLVEGCPNTSELIKPVITFYKITFLHSTYARGWNNLTVVIKFVIPAQT